MATVTPNFNWPVPTSTDLVKDGATAIEALGDSIDASLVDLKGGTTGQVLSKNSNTDMDFVWVTDAAGDITGVTAGTGISGGGTSGTVTVTNSMATAIDAKGDLVPGTGADTFARLAVGTDGQVLTADSTAATGLAWATASAGSSYVAGKNGVINAGFDVWQRATSATYNNTLSYPAADRWYGVALGAGPTCTMSQQTADTTGLTYGMRFGRNSGQTGTGDIYTGYTFESIDSKRFAGQTVTLSFYVKAGANAPSTLASNIRTGTGTNQSSATLFSAGWTGGLSNSQNNTVTTTMTRYTQTVTLGSTVNQIMLTFSYSSTGTAGANEWFQIEGVQLEIAGSASAFSRNTSTYAAELAACQRYYFRAFSDSGYKTFGVGTVTGVNNMNTFVNLPVQMRVIPTSLETSAMSTFYWEPGGGTTPTSVTLATSATQNLGNVQVNKNSSFTVGYATGLFSNNTAAYLGFSAEL
jgi:hypothetical protein